MQSIILSRRDFREFDQLVSLYTPERGKLEVLARGVKKITSKNAAHLEPFSFVLVEVVRGRQIDHLTKVVPIDLFAGIRSDLPKSLAAGYAVSFLGKMVETDEPDRKIWERTLGWLKFVDQVKPFKPILTDGYIVMLLCCLGFKPALNQCVVCRQSAQDMARGELSSGARPGLYFAGGGLICFTCLIDKKKIGEEIADCGLKEVSALQELLKGDWRLLNEFMMSDEEYQAVHTLVYEFTLYHSERKVRDFSRLVRSMVG